VEGAAVAEGAGGGDLVYAEVGNAQEASGFIETEVAQYVAGGLAEEAADDATESRTVAAN
jgi:hypothetical protein